jgi:DNA-binding MarR family transcriptional regulator
MSRDPSSLHLDRQLCFSVYAAAHALNRVYKPLLDRLGITYPQYLVLMVLWEEDGQTVSAIGRRLFLDSGTLTPLLKRMEAAGLLTRRRDAVDERQVRAQLTDRGRAMRDEVLAAPSPVLCGSGRSGEELAALKDELTRLREALDRAGPLSGEGGP